MTIKSKFAALVVALSAVVSIGCGDAATQEDIASTQNALHTCVVQAPVITETRQETAGAVAPGIRKVYHVTVRNGNTGDCAPVSLSFVPDTVPLFTVSAQPATATGVASGSTASYRVEVTSDPSIAEGVYNIGFAVTASPGGQSVRGSLAYEVDLDNPTNCFRQRPQIAVEPGNPPAVPAGTPVTYRVTIRNVDNRECGLDSFSIVPDAFQMFSLTTNGPFDIAAGGSATFTVTAGSATTVRPGIYDLGFTVVGARHGNLTNRGSVRYFVR